MLPGHYSELFFKFPPLWLPKLAWGGFCCLWSLGTRAFPHLGGRVVLCGETGEPAWNSNSTTY